MGKLSYGLGKIYWVKVSILQHIFEGLSFAGKIKKQIQALIWVLRYPNQNLDQASVLVAARTGKAATGANGITLHYVFHVPVKTCVCYFV